MIRGIFIASLMFCHLALAQQAPSGVPATCNISPNPGENSQNKSLIASQMRTRGLANPTEAQVRCIMNTPRKGRLAKLKEMIDGQQGQQAMPPKPAVGPGGQVANSLPEIFTSKEFIPIVSAPTNLDILVLANPLAGTAIDRIAIRIPKDKQEGLRGKTLRFLNCVRCTFTVVPEKRTQNLPYPLYDISGTYSFRWELPSNAPVIVTPQPVPVGQVPAPATQPIAPPADITTTKFKRGESLHVMYSHTGYEDSANTKPQIYVEYNQSTLQLSERNIQNPEFIERNNLIIATITRLNLNLTCASATCTLKPKPGNNYSEVDGQFTMSFN